jgi:predicted amidohydrolase
MIVFSELAPYGPLPSNHPDDTAKTLDAFREAARRNNVWLLPGSMFERTDAGLFNVAYVINPAGDIVTSYAKMFPFRPYEAGVEGGTEFCVFDVPDYGRFGVSICYDIWFPETTRTLASMGAEVLLHPVLTGTTDREIETCIARSTAAMFQMYVVDINGLGPGGTGRSCMIDPTGTVIYQAAGQDEVIPIEVDFDLVRRTRSTGLRGLGQTLKSFRDRSAHFGVYDPSQHDPSYLNSLGPLEMPVQGGHHGLNVPAPADSVDLAEQGVTVLNPPKSA